MIRMQSQICVIGGTNNIYFNTREGIEDNLMKKWYLTSRGWNKKATPAREIKYIEKQSEHWLAQNSVANMCIMLRDHEKFHFIRVMKRAMIFRQDFDHGMPWELLSFNCTVDSQKPSIIWGRQQHVLWEMELVVGMSGIWNSGDYVTV